MERCLIWKGLTISFLNHNPIEYNNIRRPLKTLEIKWDITREEKRIISQRKYYYIYWIFKTNLLNNLKLNIMIKFIKTFTKNYWREISVICMILALIYYWIVVLAK